MDTVWFSRDEFILVTPLTFCRAVVTEFMQPSQWSGTANVVWKSGIEFGCIMFGRGCRRWETGYSGLRLVMGGY